MNIRVTTESADPNAPTPVVTAIVPVPKGRERDYEAWAREFYGKAGRYVVGKPEVCE